MKGSPGTEGTDGKQGEEDKFKLCKVIQDDGQKNPDRVLSVILETIQEIDASVQVNASHPESHDDGDFRALSEMPSSCETGEVGPLLTNEEVSKAIQRNGSPSPAQEDAVQVDSGETRQEGLPSRKSEETQDRDQENPDLEVAEGIFGTSFKPSKWSLSRYLQSVASTREKRIVAVAAWLLSFIGLIVALVFVTKDFHESREELATTVQYEDSPSLDLPSLMLCTTDSDMPPFVDLPNGTYRGKPLFWIDYVRGTHAEINITYPDTKDLIQMSIGSYDVMGNSCNATKKMDALSFFRENTAKPSCFYCLTLNQNPPLTIKKDGETEDGTTFSRLASLRISQNAFVTQCRRSQYGLSGIMLRFLREELRSNHAALSGRGIMDFGAYDPSNRSHDGIVWPDYRLGLQNATVDFVVFDIVDMFCNVYLFSGLFYPSTSNDIRYKFDNRVYRWKRSGAGPYYPPDYFSYYTTSEQIVVYTGNDVIGQEKYENRTMYDSATVQVRTNHSRLGGVETLAALRPSQIASVALSRNLILERESFTSHVVRTHVLPGDVRAMNNIYLLDIGFKSFLTRVVADQQTVSWSAFAADFFGLTSLFMDVSVYTLIVAPLVMRRRKRALEARRRRMEADAVRVV